MAGIYIPGMEMPSGHNEATFGIDADGYPLLAVYTENNPEPEIYYITLIPDHGDLIDRNTVLDSLMNGMVMTGYQSRAMDCVNEFYVPAVIPADKEEEE